MKRDGKKKRPTRLKQNGINPKHFSAGQLKIHAYLVPICVIMALPIVFIISNAFKPIDELMAYPPRFFVRRPTLDNFISLFNLSSSTSIPASRYLFNSVITTVITVLGALIICACAAYVFSKKRFKFNGVLFKINSLALMFVPIAVSIPRYFVITYTGILDTLWANILPLLVMPTGVFLVKQFMDQLPDALIEAAVVDGANDNLSGCYMGIALLKALKDEGIELENTEIGVVLTGSEEAGLRGAKAWCEAHKGEFDDVPTFIFSYDTIHDPKYLMVNYRDLNGTVKADTDASDLFMEAANELGIQCKKGMVPPLGGATDSAAFAQGGFRSAGITGLNHKLESYYHTRRDSYDNMNLDGLSDCFAATVKVLEKFDEGAKQ